jgi:hypothetical protein
MEGRKEGREEERKEGRLEGRKGGERMECENFKDRNKLL